MGEANEAEVLAAEPASEPYQDPENQETWVPDWRIQDLNTADWALSRLQDLQRELAENEAIAEAAIQRVTLRTELLNAKVQRGVEFFESHLTAYIQGHRAELLGGGRKRTRDLLHGSLGVRKVSEALEVKDRDALLEWARAQPVESGVLRITEAPALAEIKALFKSTGEVPDGTEVRAESEEVVIRVTGGTDGTH